MLSLHSKKEKNDFIEAFFLRQENTFSFWKKEKDINSFEITFYASWISDLHKTKQRHPFFLKREIWVREALFLLFFFFFGICYVVFLEVPLIIHEKHLKLNSFAIQSWISFRLLQVRVLSFKKLTFRFRRASEGKYHVKGKVKEPRSYNLLEKWKWAWIIQSLSYNETIKNEDKICCLLTEKGKPIQYSTNSMDFWVTDTFERRKWTLY